MLAAGAGLTAIERLPKSGRVEGLKTIQSPTKILYEIAHNPPRPPDGHCREHPPGLVESERSALLEITKAEGKPEQAWEKIVEGRLSAWFRETVLLEQGLHGDKTTVQETLGEGRIVRFAQVHIGD